VLNNGDLWLGENATANAVLHLNGGLIQAAVVRPNGTAPATSTAFFNGGTLQATANSGNYIASTAFIQSGGLVLDDGGFSLNVGTLQEDGASPGGGLTKIGAGTVYLDAANSYSGLTFVTNGTLAGIGSVAGPVLVGPNGAIGAGDAGAVGQFALSSTPLTIQGKARLRINKTGGIPTSDMIVNISTVNYGGTLVISNASTDPLLVGDAFNLFNATGSTGNFTSISGSPGLGLGYSFNPATGVLTIVSAPVQPIITGISISGGNLTITGTNGTTSQQFRVLTSTNVAQSTASWTPVYTNIFSGSGFSLTIPTGGGPQRFYLIVTP
jgi:autotransporter-associated beta strand protein